MSLHNAAAILARLGPCRIALDLAAHTRLAQELALLGCELHESTPPVGEGGLRAGYLEWPRAGGPETLSDAIRPYADLDVLVLQSQGQERSGVEAVVLAEGWQRHPGGMTWHEYPQWSGHALPALTFYCRAGGAAAQGEDLLGQGGSEADALIALYALAASHVRPGDAVRVEGRCANAGARVIESLARAGDVTIAARLAGQADHSVDTFVAIYPEAREGWEAHLDECRRVLRHDGRLVLVMARAGGTGDPAPRDWNALNAALSSRFLVEKRYEQGAFSRDPLGPRGIAEIALDQADNGGPLIVVVSANPLGGAAERESYCHPAFAGSGAAPASITDFGAAYDNPWLYRTMVQMGERLGNADTLARLAEHVIGHARTGSADQGAALAVFGYRVLETRTGSAAADVVEAIRGYALAAGDAPDPHVARWTISLSFLAGRLCEMVADRAGAREWYRAAAGADWQVFSPLLATKAVAGAFHEARLAIAEGDAEAARGAFQRGVDIALAAAASPHREQMGDPQSPLGFYLTELAEVIDMGSQCANALANFGLLARDPGLFWRQVDVRRFGLATWNADVERENRALQARLAAQ